MEKILWGNISPGVEWKGDYIYVKKIENDQLIVLIS